MVKNFAPRVLKSERKYTQINDSINRDIIKFNEDRLLKGAQLLEVQLGKITVKNQVRTKFDDESLRELSENIKANGLIQPLVIHREGSHFVLLCGERRFRAMNLIKMDKAPCYVLEGKTEEELMAIQFSENSSREELHYIDKADGIYHYHVATKATERKIQADLGISKTEVHRGIILAKLPKSIKEAAKIHNVEKYVLLEFEALKISPRIKDELKDNIVKGVITKRSQLTKFKSQYRDEFSQLKAATRQKQKGNSWDRDLSH
jgi:ParB family chromosome partitioning protein